MGEHINKIKGRIKQAVGDLTGSKKYKRSGKKDEIKGQAQGVVEDVKHAAKDVEKSNKQDPQ